MLQAVGESLIYLEIVRSGKSARLWIATIRSWPIRSLRIATDRSANPFHVIHRMQCCEYVVRERQRARIFLRHHQRDGLVVIQIVLRVHTA